MTMTQTEFDRATRPPRHTELPDFFALPDDLTAAVKERDAAYEKWVDVEDQAVAAWLAVDRAKSEDHAALVQAVADGKSDPGTAGTEKAERALVVALERVRQTRQAADAADGKVAKAYKAAMPALVPQATESVREAVESYRAKRAEAKQKMSEADDELRTAHHALLAIRDYMAPAMLYHVSGNAPAVNWDDTQANLLLAGLNERCDRIEEYADRHHNKLAAS